MDRTTPTPGRPVLRLSLMGCFELTWDEEVLKVSAPAQRLLSILAICHRDRPAARTALAERLWPDVPPERAAASLRSVLWRLPRPRARALVTGTADQVRLGPDLCVDLWEGEGRARALAADVDPAPPADLSVLTHDLLPTWHEDWLEVERESYRQRRLHALEACTRLLLRAGRYTDALAVGLEAVRADPLRETAHRRVIEVHLAEGNQGEALRQYEGYRFLLARELGLRPSAGIRQLVGPLLGRPVDV